MDAALEDPVLYCTQPSIFRDEAEIEQVWLSTRIRNALAKQE